jgi:hypothetical protein
MRIAGPAGGEVGKAPVPAYAPGGTNPDPVLQTVVEMLRANREAEAEQAGNTQPLGHKHANVTLWWGTFIFFRQVP